MSGDRRLSAASHRLSALLPALLSGLLSALLSGLLPALRNGIAAINWQSKVRANLVSLDSGMTERLPAVVHSARP